MVPVELRRLLIDQHNNDHAIYLGEKDGPRGLPIVIGIFEATIIDRLLKGLQAPRPLTHDLLLSVIGALGAELVQSEIDGIEEDCYLAKLRLARDGREQTIDCRPSDAIVLALQADAPILVSEVLFDAAPAG